MLFLNPSGFFHLAEQAKRTVDEARWLAGSIGERNSILKEV